MANLAKTTFGEGQTPTSEIIIISDTELAEHEVKAAGPIQWTKAEQIFYRAVSIGVTPTEIYRVELMQLTGYSISVTVIGVDNGNGNIKKQTGDFTLERLNASPILIGETFSVPHQSTNASTWKIDRSFVQSNGQHFGVIWVVGAAGRTIDWMVRGEMFRFSPSVPTPTPVPVPDPPLASPIGETE